MIYPRTLCLASIDKQADEYLATCPIMFLSVSAISCLTSERVAMSSVSR